MASCVAEDFADFAKKTKVTKQSQCKENFTYSDSKCVGCDTTCGKDTFNYTDEYCTENNDSKYCTKCKNEKHKYITMSGKNGDALPK